MNATQNNEVGNEASLPPDNFDAASFRPQEVLSMGTQLHRLLRAAIIRSELAPGQLISEGEMSRRFSISRQPVREAFIKLAEERLIEVMPQRGTIVRKISVKEVLEAQHLRELIEVSIAREVAATQHPALIDALRELIIQQAAVPHGDSRSFLALDEAFHKALAYHAKREYAWRVTESIKAQMDRVRFLSFDFATPTAELIAEHAALVDAIAAANADLAAAHMSGHLKGILASLPRIAAHYPEHFVAD